MALVSYRRISVYETQWLVGTSGRYLNVRRHCANPGRFNYVHAETV